MSLEKNFKEELLNTFELYAKKNRKSKSIDELLNYGVIKKLIDEKDIQRYMIVNEFDIEIGKGIKKSSAYKLIAKKFKKPESTVRNIVKNYSLGYQEKAN